MDRKAAAGRGSYVTYIRNVREAPQPPPELGETEYLALALARTAEVFEPGLSAKGETVGQITSSGVRASFKKSLPLQSSKIAIKGASMGKRSETNVDIVRS